MSTCLFFEISRTKIEEDISKQTMLSKIESKYSVTNLDDKAEDAENIELKRKKSDAPKIKKTLKLTGKSEY